MINQESELKQYIDLCKKISENSDAVTSKKLLDECEKLQTRWKSSVLDLEYIMNTVNCNNIEKSRSSWGSSWAENAFSCITKQVNSSDVDQLQTIISSLTDLQRESSQEINNCSDQHERDRIQRIIKILPKRISFLDEKKQKILIILERTRELHQVIESLETNVDGNNLIIQEKDFDFKKLFSDVNVLEQEVRAGGFSLQENLSNSIKQLQSSWSNLLASVSVVDTMLSSPSTVSTSQDMILSPSSSSISNTSMMEDAVKISTSSMVEDEAPGSTAVTRESLSENSTSLLTWLEKIGKTIFFI